MPPASDDTPASGKVCIISRPAPGAGFFSNLNWILQHLGRAEERGWRPVVDMERHPTNYNEPQPLNGTKNAWEYYFEQPAGLTVAEALAMPHVESCDYIPKRADPYGVGWPEDERERLARLVQKYVRVRPDVTAVADAVLPPGKTNVLGIHVRGTDMRQGTLPEHPIPDVVEAYLELAKVLDRKHRFDAVFLACDEPEVVGLFTGAFGARLLTATAHRTPAAQSASKDLDWLLEVDRPLHRYLLGREVLVDMLLLARCEHLVCGVSNVSAMSTVFAKAPQHVHALPPIWVTPTKKGVSKSAGILRRMMDQPPGEHETAEVLLAQKRALCAMLIATENRLEAGLSRSGKFKARLSKWRKWVKQRFKSK